MKKIKIEDPKIYKSTLKAKNAALLYGQFVANASGRKVEISVRTKNQKGIIEFKPQKPKHKTAKK